MSCDLYLFLVKFIAGDANKLLTANFIQPNYTRTEQAVEEVVMVKMTTAERVKDATTA